MDIEKNSYDKSIASAWLAIKESPRSQIKELIRKPSVLNNGCYLTYSNINNKEVYSLNIYFLKGNTKISIKQKFKGMNLFISYEDKNPLLIIKPTSKKYLKVFEHYLPYFFLKKYNDLLSDKDIKLILSDIAVFSEMSTSMNKEMTNSMIIGLYGELLYLIPLIKNRKNVEEILKSWQKDGQTNNDFIFKNKEVEIKCSSNDKKVISISSEFQLDSFDLKPVEIELFRIQDSKNGKSLDDLINAAINLLDKRHSLIGLFYCKLGICGYKKSKRTLSKKFIFISQENYKITESFPILSKRRVHRSLSNIRYQIDLNNLDE